MDTSQHTYLLALEIAPITVGQAYEHLPMHCTIMPRFHSTLSPVELIKNVEPIFAQASPIELIPQEHVAFGPHKQLVTLIEPTEAITKLHLDLFHKLNELKVKYTERDWVAEGFVPHITDKQGKRLPTKAPTVASAVYLISFEHPLQGQLRTVVSRINLV